jgi:hypothetical protein
MNLKLSLSLSLSLYIYIYIYILISFCHWNFEVVCCRGELPVVDPSKLN